MEGFEAKARISLENAKARKREAPPGVAGHILRTEIAKEQASLYRDRHRVEQAEGSSNNAHVPRPRTKSRARSDWQFGEKLEPEAFYGEDSPRERAIKFKEAAAMAKAQRDGLKKGGEEKVPPAPLKPGMVHTDEELFLAVEFNMKGRTVRMFMTRDAIKHGCHAKQYNQHKKPIYETDPSFSHQTLHYKKYAVCWEHDQRNVHIWQAMKDESYHAVIFRLVCLGQHSVIVRKMLKHKNTSI